MPRIRRIDLTLLPRDNDASNFACTLYVINEEASSYFKIGITGHPIRRRSHLQCGNYRSLFLVAVYEGTRTACREVERNCHKFFNAKAGSEWIYADNQDDIIRYLDSFLEEQV